MDHMASDMSHGGMEMRGSAAAGPSSTVEATDRLKVIQEKNTHAQRKIRQRQKEKLTSMNQQLADLEAQLLAVQMECKQLDVENEVLLRQAEEKEAELQREKTKLAQHRKQQQDSGMQATDVHRPPEQGSSAGMSSDDASAAKAASDLHEEPILVVRSCPGQVFEVTKSVLEVFPRHQLENIYSTLLRTMNESLQRFEEAERMMKDAMLRTELSISQRASSVAELEGVMRQNHRVLENVVKDLVPLYCHAFRSHPKETYQMDVQAASASRGPTGTLLSQDVQATLKISGEQQQHVLNSTMRYLSAVKDCMDQRKTLHSKLSQNEAALLEWESVASWLASDALVNALQTTLAKEVDIYLEWSTYICLNVFSPPQTAKYLLSAPLRDLLQVCMSVVRASHDNLPSDHMSGSRMGGGASAMPASAMPRGPSNPNSAAPGMMSFPDMGGAGDASQFPNLDVFRNSSNPRGF